MVEANNMASRTNAKVKYGVMGIELRQPVMALSLGGLRRKIEIALLLDDVDVRLVLDRSALVVGPSA
jgi:hypothetical protein